MKKKYKKPNAKIYPQKFTFYNKEKEKDKYKISKILAHS